MRIAFISVYFTPTRNSAAVQMHDLVAEVLRQGHKPTVFVPIADMDEPFRHTVIDGIDVVHLKSPQFQDLSYLWRTLNEAVMPWYMRKNLANSPFADAQWDKIVWYSPSIFLAPFVAYMKNKSGCRSYMIIRDVFPEWALDIGLIRKGIPYWIFRAIAAYQNSVADIIGVQAPGELPYFSDRIKPDQSVEVLQNWLSEPVYGSCSIDVSKTHLAGRKILVYAGNIGAAQGADTMFTLVQSLKEHENIGFLFVGRGSDKLRLEKAVHDDNLNNVMFHSEIDPSEIPGLYAQCHAGIVILDPRHTTHNIPGKFISYMRCGLPVLASINHGNDLNGIIRDNNVGEISKDNTVDSLRQATLTLCNKIEQDSQISMRCEVLGRELFSPQVAVQQILEA
jgi:glycosyltransferase involved in cell wall biosynthesis